MVSAGAREGASPSWDLRWMHCIIAHPVAHAIVYGVFSAMWSLSAGSALRVLGRRAGGAVGACLVSARNAAVHVYVWPFLLPPLVVHLFGLRAAVAAMDSLEPLAPKRRPAASTGAMLCTVLGYLVKDVPKLASMLLSFLVAVGCWMEMGTLGKGSLQEKAGAFMFDIEIVSIAVIHCFFVCPVWVAEWRTGQKH